MSSAVLFVCTANICRSPMAEGALRGMLAKARNGIEIASVGTHDYHVGMPAFPEAVEAAKRRGYDITRHVARQINAGDLDRYDLILAMDRFNMACLKSVTPTRHKNKLEFLLDYGTDFRGREIPDPYRGSSEDFEIALDMIEDGCRGLLRLLAR